jgi:GxxExxY protein
MLKKLTLEGFLGYTESHRGFTEVRREYRDVFINNKSTETSPRILENLIKSSHQKLSKRIRNLRLISANLCGSSVALCVAKALPKEKNIESRRKNPLLRFLHVFYLLKSCMDLNELSSKIIGAAIEVHRKLGPGLLESTYQQCLGFELKKLQLMYEQQVPQPLIYKNVHLDLGYRIDLLVEKRIIVELKSVDKLIDIHDAQALTYLKLSNAELALLINFNVLKLVDGIKRFIRKG